MASLGGRRFTAGFVALLALGIAASYSNSLGIGFYFDDLYGIHNNPTIRSLRNIPTFFTDPHAFWTDRTQADVRLPAAAAALFFALAPLNTQPVDYVWARSALLSTTLYLGAFLAFLRRRWTLGAVLFALALLTKAIAVTLPAMLLIHDFVYRDRTRYRSVTSYLGDWRRLVLPVLLPAALALAYV